MTGLDKFIHDQNRRFIDKLFPSIVNAKKAYYGRVYKNVVDGDVVKAVIHIEGTNDYKDVRFDDSKSAQCFYDPSDEKQWLGVGQYTQDCSIIFGVNLKDLYPLETIRAIEQCHSDVCREIETAGLFTIRNIVTGSNVFGDISDTDLKKYDSHPKHVFRINCTSKPFSINCNYKNY